MNVTEFQIGEKTVGEKHPAYFIADISANHDGDLERAKALIHLAAESGADAAKFQNFRAEHIVSDRGFRSLGGQQSHQSKWKKSVFEVYKDATVPWDWTPLLKQECDRAGICFFSTPYDLAAVDMLNAYVPAYKIGSGDLTWPEICLYMAKTGKPIILATGASDIGEVVRAVRTLQSATSQLGLMQCNTNYTGSIENFRHINLRVLESYRAMFPEMVLGLSDHTPGHATVLGAVALGARLIEKHFTDDTSREGPDHPFSMTPAAWREMVDRTQELQAALGSTIKEVAPNEQETIVIQRRCVRAADDLPVGHVLNRSDLVVLRPAPIGAIQPYEIDRLIGRRLSKSIQHHDCVFWNAIE